MIRLDPDACKVHTIILPFCGKYLHKRLPIGMARSLDIFESKKSNLIFLVYLRVYLDNLFVLTKDSFEDHLMTLEVVFEAAMSWFEYQYRERYHLHGKNVNLGCSLKKILSPFYGRYRHS